MRVRPAFVAVVLAAAIAVGAFDACGERPAGPTQSSPDDTIATILLTPANPTISLGTNIELTALLADSVGGPLTTTGRIIEWSSTRTDIARVSDQGVVTALELGTATISAMSERKIGSTVVTVVQPVVANVFVSPPSATVVLGRTVQLTAVATDATGLVLNGKLVLWTTSNPTTSVNDAGLVTGLVLGTSTIYAQVDGAVGFATVVVIQPPE